MKYHSLTMLKYSLTTCAVLFCGSVMASPRHVVEAPSGEAHLHYCGPEGIFSGAGNIVDCSRSSEPVYVPQAHYESGVFTISGINGI